jgi:hypothetical protein
VKLQVAQLLKNFPTFAHAQPRVILSGQQNLYPNVKRQEHKMTFHPVSKLRICRACLFASSRHHHVVLRHRDNFPNKTNKINSGALVRQRNILTERPPLVGEVREGVGWSAQRIPTAVNLGFFRPEPLLSFQVGSQLFSRLSGPRSRPTTSQKIWYCRESKPGPPDL